jgi:hypothetical protein
VLGGAQGGSFAGRSTHDQGAGAFFDLALTKWFQRGAVDFAGIVERRRKVGGVGAQLQDVTCGCGHGRYLRRLGAAASYRAAARKWRSRAHG